jgi:hypothetical protein
MSTRAARAAALAGFFVLALAPVPGIAQSVQVAPFGGYRFGGDLYETITATPLDIDGAPSFGATLDVFISRGLSVTFLYSHQEANVDVPLFGPGFGTTTTRSVDLAVDHWQVGGTQEVGQGAVRPFYTGLLGLTYFGNSDDSEIRFSLGGGGGVKLMPSRHVGARLDGRVYAVFVDGGSSAGICGGAGCIIAFDASVVWQLEFTAGVVFSF